MLERVGRGISNIQLNTKNAWLSAGLVHKTAPVYCDRCKTGRRNPVCETNVKMWWSTVVERGSDERKQTKCNCESDETKISKRERVQQFMTSEMSEEITFLRTFRMISGDSAKTGRNITIGLYSLVFLDNLIIIRKNDVNHFPRPSGKLDNFN